MSVVNGKKQFLLLMGVMFGISVLIYWHVFSLPFVSDDWWYLQKFQSSSTPDLLRYFFDPHSKLVYRPLAEACMILMYNLFGFDPVPMRVLGLFVHVANSLLVVFILGYVLEDRSVAYISGIIFASAVAVHLDLFTWAWGAYYDIGGTFFFLLSIWLYLNERITLSALAYFVGCLFKESVVFLPMLLFFHSLILNEEKGAKGNPLRWLGKWAPFLFFGIIVIGFKIIGGGNPAGLGEDHPYAIAFTGNHLVTNGERYLSWLFQAIFPFYSSTNPAHKILAGTVFIIGLAVFGSTLLAIKRNRAFRRLAFFICWLVAGILPVYLLPNHTYRYYLIYSLPAFAAIFFYSIHCMLGALKASPKIVSAGLIFAGCFALAGSSCQSNRIYNEKLEQNTFADGTNLLIRRAATIDLVSKKLHQDFQSLPPGLVIVLINADLGAFGVNNLVLQTQFDTDEFDVLPPSAISYENGDWSFTTPDSAPRYLDPSLAVVYELKDNSIVRHDLVDLLQPSTAP